MVGEMAGAEAMVVGEMAGSGATVVGEASRSERRMMVMVSCHGSYLS